MPERAKPVPAATNEASRLGESCGAPRGGTRKFWRWVVRSTEFRPWARSRGVRGSLVPSGRTPSIASRLRWKSSLEGLKVRVDHPPRPPREACARAPRSGRTGCPASVLKSARRGYCSPLAVELAVGPANVHLEPGGRLDRGAVADRTEAVEVRLHVRGARRVLRALRQRLSALARLEPRPEGGVDAVAEVEVEVPGFEVFVDVREVQVGAARRVPAPDVDQPEGLEVGDRRLSCVCVCVDVKPRRAVPSRGSGRPLGPPPRSPSASAGSSRRRSHRPGTPSDARQLEQVARLVEERLRAVSDVLALVAADRSATSLASGMASSGSLGKRLASSSADTGCSVLRGPEVDGNVHARELRDVTPEMREPQAAVTARPAGVTSARRFRARSARARASRAAADRRGAARLGASR